LTYKDQIWHGNTDGD